jgi:hypothetical protein
MFPFPTDVQSFVLWIGSAGAGGVFMALVLERIPAFRDLSSPWKSRLVVALFVALPYVAAGLSELIARLDPATVAAVQYWLSLGLAGLTAWAASQYAHGADPAK